MRAGRRVRAAMGLLVLLAWSAGLLGLPPAALAQQKKTAPPALVKLAEGLLRSDVDDRLVTVTELRKNPEGAREAIAYLLDKSPSAKDRGRLAYHLIEFGDPENIALLAQLHAESKDPDERKALQGAMVALYASSGSPKELQNIGMDLTFVQSGPTTPIQDERTGGWAYTAWSFQLLHRRGLPLSLIEQVRAVPSRGFDTREELGETLKKRLKKDDWEKYHTLLEEAADQFTAKAEVEGRVRVRVTNPLTIPLLMRVNTGVWYGRFKTEPEEYWLYLPPGQTQRVELPLTAIGVRPERGLRVHLMVREVNGNLLPSPQPLIVPLHS